MHDGIFMECDILVYVYNDVSGKELKKQQSVTFIGVPTSPYLSNRRYITSLFINQNFRFSTLKHLHGCDSVLFIPLDEEERAYMVHSRLRSWQSNYLLGMNSRLNLYSWTLYLKPL